MKFLLLLSTMMAVCCRAVVGHTGAGSWAGSDWAGVQENPSHAALRSAVRQALDPSRTDALEEAVDAASVGADSRQVREIVGLAYAEFGARARLQNFNRLLGSNTGHFLPRLMDLLGLDARHLDDLREAAFPEMPAPELAGAWRLHKLVHGPRDGGGGTRLSCLLVHVTERGSFDVLVVASATARRDLGGEGLLLLETTPAERMGQQGGREALLARTGREAGLTETDAAALMAFAELNCLRKLGDYFGVAFDK